MPGLDHDSSGTLPYNVSTLSRKSSAVVERTYPELDSNLFQSNDTNDQFVFAFPPPAALMLRFPPFSLAVATNRHFSVLPSRTTSARMTHMYGTPSLRNKPDLLPISFSATASTIPPVSSFTLIGTAAPSDESASALEVSDEPRVSSAKSTNTVPVMVGEGVAVAVTVAVGVGVADMVGDGVCGVCRSAMSR